MPSMFRLLTRAEGFMAGETAIVYESSPPPRAELQRPVATAWLLCLWVLAASAAAGGVTWTWLVPPRWLSSGIVLMMAVVVGGPLFLVSWAYLAAAIGFRHRPFLLLLGTWTLTAILAVPPAMPAIARDDPNLPLLITALPLVSSLAMLWVVMTVRLAQPSTRVVEANA